MHTITFTCEIITPMFLAGADGTTFELRFPPELRPPSFKGVLRFWWRAMHGNMAIAVLKQEEAALFGGGGEKARRSPVMITIDSDHAIIQRNGDIGIDQQKQPGIGYLFYSTVFVQQRDCFKSGSEFAISFSSYSLKSLEGTVKAFACLVFFGGLGSRSRRGAGSIFVKAIGGNAKELLNDVLKVFDTAAIDNADRLKEHLETYIKPIIKSSSAVGSYSALNGAPLHVFEPKTNWILSLEYVGSKFKTVRDSIQHDVGGTPNFGMPIRHKSDPNRHISGLTLIAGTIFKNHNQEWKTKRLSERRASPLIIKVIKTKDRCYFPIVLHLQGALLPAGQQIIDKQAEKLNSVGDQSMNPDGTYIKTKFLDKLIGAITMTL
jgi:CRISPR-associated protein Cmr1